MKRRRASAAIAIALCVAVIAAFALRGRGTETRIKPALDAPPPVEIAGPPAARVAEAPRPAPSPPAAPEPSKPSPEEALRRLFEGRLKVRVTHAGRAVSGCTFSAERDGAAPIAPSSQGAASVWPERELLGFPQSLAAPFVLVVHAPGDLVARAPVGTLDASIDVALPVGGRVEGTLRKRLGDSLVGATVVFAGHTATTRESGLFAFDPVAVGPHDPPKALVDGVWRTPTCDAAQFAITRDGETRQVALVIEPAPRVHVRVVRATDGRPVAGATIRIDSRDGGPSAWAEMKTDADGRAFAEGLRRGEYEIDAAADDTEEVRACGVPLPREDELDLRIADYTPHRVFGRVTDAAQRPIAGVEIKPASIADDIFRKYKDVLVVVTDKDGAFALSLPAPVMRDIYPWIGGRDGHMWLAAWPGDPNSPPCAFAAPLDRETTLVLTKPAVLTGTIVDSDGGRPPDRLWVRFVDDQGRLDPYDSARPNSHAVELRRDPRDPGVRFKIEDASALPGRIFVSTPWLDGRRELHGFVRVTPAAGKTTDVGTIRLEQPTRIRVFDVGDGRALDAHLLRRTAAGGGLSDAADSYAWRDGTSWSDDDTPPGPQQLVAWSSGRLAVDLGEVVVAPHATTDVKTHLPRAGEIHVLVRRGDRVVAGAAVTLALPDVAPQTLEFRDVVDVRRGRVERLVGPGMDLATTTDADGRAWFRRLPPGRCVVTLVDEGKTTLVERLLAEGADEEFDVDLAR